MPRYGIGKYPARILFDDVGEEEVMTVATAMLRGAEAEEGGAAVITEMYRESLHLIRSESAVPFDEGRAEELADTHCLTMLPILVRYLESFLNDGRLTDWFFARSVLSGYQLMTGFSFFPIVHEARPEATLILQTILVRFDQKDTTRPDLFWVPASPPPVYSGLMGGIRSGDGGRCQSASGIAPALCALCERCIRARYPERAGRRGRG